MKIVTTCPSCKARIKMRTGASTRPELQMKKGDEFDVKCLKCGKVMRKHVNDFKALTNKTVIMIGIIIGVLVTVVLWNIYGAIGTLSVIIPILFWQQQMKTTRAFNSYMVKRK